MYSYEDRIRAVELYIKLGKRVRTVLRRGIQALSGGCIEDDPSIRFIMGVWWPTTATAYRNGAPEITKK